MQRRIVFFVLFAVFAAALFVRLGFWQLHRLGERQAANAVMSARLSAPIVDLRTLGADTAAGRFRRARVAGTPDYAHEIVVAARSHEGSPGVNILTPVRVPGTDTALLVNRGWVYAPDGVTVDLSSWREVDTVFTGYADALGVLPISLPGSRGGSRTVRRLDEHELAALLPYPISALYLVAVSAEPVPSSGGAARPSPVRLSMPSLDEGPHLGYAVQWFSFATIAVVGAAVIAVRTRGAKPDRTSRVG
jgi:surfeit locus 1 family protein